MSVQTTCLPEWVTHEIGEELLRPEPDAARLHRVVATSSGIGAADARCVLYETVRRLNAALLPRLTKMELMLTERCNLRCSYCFEKGTRDRGDMPFETARAALDLLLDYSRDANEVEVTLFGGEPTLDFALFRRVTEYAERRAAAAGKTIDLGTTTNAVGLTAERAEYLADHGIKALLSIDGLQATHDRYRVDAAGRGTFQRVLDGLRALKRVQPWIGAKLTVAPEAAPDLYLDVVGLHDLGVNQFVIGPATGVGWSRKQRATFCRQLRRLRAWYQDRKRRNVRINEFEEKPTDAVHFGCQAGRQSICVSVTGELSGCAKILSLDNRDLLERLGDVAYGVTHLRNRIRIVRCDELEARCHETGIADDYTGGCFATNYEVTGDLYSPSVEQHTFATMIRAACRGS